MAARHTPHTMKHELLKAVATGDADLLAQVLGVWSTMATAEETEGDESCLKGVTADGRSALHIAASRGYLELVVMICTQDISLIKARSNQLDTPLICAARAGHADVVDYLIKRASAQQEAEYPILRVWNSDGATAMHEAVRNGHASILRKLVLGDSRLAAMVDGEGVSPLYLAVVSNRADMVDILTRESPDGVKSPASYAGPGGQTALHAAVYASNAQEMSKSLLCWEPTLAEKADPNGRTALHYAASAEKSGVVKLLLANTSLAYIPDKDGLFPVHAAAITGNTNVIREFLKICPSCDDLLDNKRRNILHYAVDHGRIMLVWHICRNPKFARMMNARDNEGNTPLHLAVKHRHVTVFFILMMDLMVNLGIPNHEGLTPLDVASIENWRNYSFLSYTGFFIEGCLRSCKAYGTPFRDLTDKLCLEDKEKLSSIYTNVSQSILYVSVLTATVSFAAAFTPPGGYIAEGAKAGMPVLGEYTEFREYVMANSFSFYASTCATCLLVHTSVTNIPMRTRRMYLDGSIAAVYCAVLFMLNSFLSVVMLTLDSADNIVFLIILTVVRHVALVLPMSILAVPVCFRVALQLGTSKHPWQDMLTVLVAASYPTIVVRLFIINVESVVERGLPGRQESCSWHGCRDAMFSHPT